MKCRLIAAGTRLPSWIDAGFADYQRRLVRPFRLALAEVAVAKRREGEPPTRAIEREGELMSAALGKDDVIVALEVRGKAVSTEELARWLGNKLQGGRDMSFLIGGPDGIAPGLLARAEWRWSLSPLTFPHALVRVMVAEQLYRAASIIAGHPYHRA